jgi:hypothetical protein
MINEDDPEDVKSYMIRSNQYDKVGKQYLTKVKISSYKIGYKYIALVINGKRKRIKLHRLNYYAHNQDWDLFDSSKNNQIDHIDRNPSNNHISNLRVVTNQQNNFNRSNVKGYYWYKPRNKWRSIIILNGKTKHLGLHDTEEDARKTYLEAKKIYHII